MKRKYIWGISGFFAVLFLISWVDSYYFKINKSFEIFGSIFKYISNSYVEDIDPEQLVKYGIEGLMENLDPYTEYYDESETEDIDLLTTGTYTGLGISVAIKDGKLTIIGLRDGYSAQKNGVRIGDRLYKIDTAIVINGSPKDLRNYTRGELGSVCDFWVLRDGLKDTLKFRLTREEISVKNVSYHAFLEKNIAYIKLERFSRNSAREVRAALSDLHNQDSISGIILDLRDNPGGLLESAVSICEIFVPTGSVIVTTRGRNKRDEIVYKSYQKPVEPTTPLAVLINENSASASEIVAGAIQDLDRGIIVGRRSYGKGLVQSVYSLPYNGNLKMTTAKYYTPSGRCIQKIELLKDHGTKSEPNKSTDTTLFYTTNGRPVTEFVGITPDTTIPGELYSQFVNELLVDNIIFNYANQFTSGKQSLKDNFSVDPSIIKDFDSFYRQSKHDYRSDLMMQLSEMKKNAVSEKIPDKTIQQVNILEEMLKKDEKELVKLNSIVLSKLLNREILARFLNEKSMIEQNLKTDKVTITAVNLLKSDNYEEILAIRMNDDYER